MRKNTIHYRNSLWNAAWGCGIALLLAGTPGLAQSAKVARDSLQFTPDLAKKELAVGFRLVDDVNVTSVQAATEGKKESLPATWEAWEGDKAPACAWMIVVDTSNPARAKTVATCVEFVRSFLTSLPKQDKVAVFALARDLSEVVPFDSMPEDRAKALTGIKPAGDASLTTLIHSNLRDGLGRLAERKEPRKAVMILTDGIDETPGGPAAQEIEKKKLIDAAKSAGIAVHAVGYAESADDQKHFGALKEIAAQTDGLFVPTSLASKDTPSGTLSLLRGVMHGAGTVRIDLSKLAEPVALTVTAKTAAGKTAVLQVPREKVMEIVPPVVAPKTPEEPTKADKEKAIADKAAADQLAKEKELADQAAADKLAKEKEAADQAADKKKKIWIGVGSGVVLLVLIVALLMVRASRKRAAEEVRLAEEARMAEEERAAQEARRAEEARRQAEETKKAEVAPLAWLEMCDAQQTRHPVRISSLKIGRGQHNDLTLRNDSVSGNHCVLNCNRDKEWSITDLNSGNGVVLNGERVMQAALRHGDVIELGELKMRFLLRA
jgi:hypothetical protein